MGSRRKRGEDHTVSHFRLLQSQPASEWEIEEGDTRDRREWEREMGAEWLNEEMLEQLFTVPGAVSWVRTSKQCPNVYDMK
jgi:hypothetical protein